MKRKIYAIWVLLVLPLLAVSRLAATETEVTVLVPGTPMHGIQGLAWGPDGFLYAGAISAQTISRIDPRTGEVTVVVPPPDGEADDVAVGPDLTLAWSAIVESELRIKRPDGPVQVIGKNLLGINPVAFRNDGALFAGQLAITHALHEFDISGERPPRLVTTEIEDLNGFEFGADGRLYGPFWQTGVLVAIDVETGEVTRIAEGLGTPSAVNLDSKGRLISVDYNSGKVHRTEPETGEFELLAELEPPLDNLAVGSDDTIYVSDTAKSGVLALDPETGNVRRVVGGEFSTPGGMTTVQREGREWLMVADSTGYRYVDPSNGRVDRPKFNFRFGGSLDVASDDGTMILTDARQGRVTVFGSAGEEPFFDQRSFKAPYGAAVLEDGSVLVADYGANALFQIDTSGSSTVVKELTGPVGIAKAEHNTIYVTENAGGSVVRLSTDTWTQQDIVTGLNRPEGIALMSDGRVAVVEAGAARVIAIDPENGTVVPLAENLPLDVAVVRVPPEVGMPTGLAVGQDGAIYVSCPGDNSVRKIVIK